MGDVFQRIAPAKLNLFLHVTGKRNDGYHLLQSLVTFCAFGDEISVAESDELSLEISGEYGDDLRRVCPDISGNIIGTVAAHLRRRFSVTHGAKISLNKQLPIAAGVGGGSADGAAAAHLLNRLWGLGLSDQTIADELAYLGADIPMCVMGVASLAEGVGDVLTPIRSISDDAIELPILLVNPGVECFTPAVYQALPADSYVAGDKEIIDKIRSRAASVEVISDFLHENTHNALQKPAISMYSSIADVLNVLEGLSGVSLVRMSGSGATCFAIFSSSDAAKVAEKQLVSSHSEWWVRRTHCVM